MPSAFRQLWQAAQGAPRIPPGWRLRSEQRGVLCFHRASGLNVLFDEIRTRPLDRFPRYVQLSLLDACNLRCAFCYASKAGQRWDRDELLQLAKKLDAWGVLELALAGGEPFAYPDFDRLLTELWEKTSLAVHVTTNATLVPPHFVERVAGRIGQIRISVDGVGATYEAHREIPFERVVEGIRRLRGLRRGLNCLIGPQTLVNMPELLDFAEAEGIDDLLFLRPLPPADPLPDALLPSVRRAAETAIARGFRLSLSSSFGDIGVPRLFAEPPARDSIYVTSDRRVARTSADPERIAFRDFEELRAIYEAWHP